MKLMYKVIDQSPDIVFPFHSIWNPTVPPKMGFFAWEGVKRSLWISLKVGEETIECGVLGKFV